MSNIKLTEKVTGCICGVCVCVCKTLIIKEEVTMLRWSWGHEKSWRGKREGWKLCKYSIQVIFSKMKMLERLHILAFQSHVYMFYGENMIVYQQGLVVHVCNLSYSGG